MYEYSGNLHCHSHYSDGFGSHNQIARAALSAGLDFVVVTDHNVYVKGMDGYRFLGDRRILLLTGEEIHDQGREPQKNHLLAYETGLELAPLAAQPQRLINAVTASGGLAFLAHPVDPPAPSANEPDLSWVDWNVKNYTGIEVWNYLSGFKAVIPTAFKKYLFAFFPALGIRGPLPESLALWDRLTAAGKQVVAIGNADAHEMPVKLGPFHFKLFQYESVFRAVNTHILTEEALSGNADHDRALIFDSIRRGHAFIGYDLPASTRGFQFSAFGDETAGIMGDSLMLGNGITLQIKLPRQAEIRLYRNGDLVQKWDHSETAHRTIRAAGVYRCEASLPYLGAARTWVLSNPIYIRECVDLPSSL